MIPFFKKQEKRNIKMPAHLTRAEQKEIREIIKRAEKDDGIPRTAQQSIPFDRMFQDGICRIGSDYYTKTLQFQDINPASRFFILHLSVASRLSLIFAEVACNQSSRK